MQQAFRTKTLVTKDGKPSIKGLPFHADESVEVTVRRGKKFTRAAKYPLRGKPIIYRDPFKGVAVSDWEVTQWSYWVRIFGFGGFTETKDFLPTRKFSIIRMSKQLDKNLTPLFIKRVERDAMPGEICNTIRGAWHPWWRGFRGRMELLLVLSEKNRIHLSSKGRTHDH